jgi:DNA-binding phage protein
MKHKAQVKGKIGSELQALLSEISQEEIETGLLQAPELLTAKTWTPTEIQNTVQTELGIQNLGKLLALAQAEQGKSLAEVSKSTGVSRGRVHQREQESANLEMRSFVEQARALGFDVIVTLKPKHQGRELRAEIR